MVDSQTIMLISAIAVGGIVIYTMKNHKNTTKKQLPKPHRVNYTAPPDPFLTPEHKTKLNAKMIQQPHKTLIKSLHFL